MSRDSISFVLRGFALLGDALDVEFAIYATLPLSLFVALRGFRCSAVTRLHVLCASGFALVGDALDVEFAQSTHKGPVHIFSQRF